MRLGIDIGGTKTAAVAIGEDGELSDQVRMPTGFGAEEVVATALRTVERMTELAGVPASSFASIGIGIPGAVDSEPGRVAHAVNLGLEGLDLGPRLADRLGVDVRVENDVKAAAVGAHHLLGVADGIRAHSMAYLNLGTGLAAGIVLDGRLLRGGHGVAGEIGHIPVDPAGVVCSCGQRGCLETLASGSAIARMWPTDGAASREGRCSTRPMRATSARSRCASGSSRASPRRCGCSCSRPTSTTWSSAGGSPRSATRCSPGPAVS